MAIIKDRRILELAMKGLEAERDVLASEIAELRAKLVGKIATRKRRRATKALKKEVAKTVKQTVASAKKMSVAQRKVISQKMKAVWAKRKKTAR